MTVVPEQKKWQVDSSSVSSETQLSCSDKLSSTTLENTKQSTAILDRERAESKFVFPPTLTLRAELDRIGQKIKRRRPKVKDKTQRSIPKSKAQEISVPCSCTQWSADLSELVLTPQ
jgi:hypothetical protein